MQHFVPPPTEPVETPADVCPDCHGRGWKVVSDGGAGAAVRCDCRKRSRTRENLDRAGIPERYRRCRLEKFQTRNLDTGIEQQLLRAYQVSRGYVDRFFDPQENRFRESGLLYVGPPGVGKTHLAVAVLRELIERYGVRGCFVDFTALLHQIQSTFDPQSVDTKHSILRPVIGAEVLVLDELGAQKPTEWVQDVLYLIINTRYVQRLPTLFTTNYRLETPAQVAPQKLDRGPDPKVKTRFGLLATRISPLLVSRLFEMTQPVTLAVRPSAWDYRREVKMHQHRIGR